MLKKNLHKCFGGIKCLPTSDPLTIEEDDDYEEEEEVDEKNYDEEERNDDQQQQLEEEERKDDQQQQLEEKEQEEEEEELLKSSSNSLPIIDLSNTITTTTSDPFSSSSNEFSFESEDSNPDLDFSTVIATSSRRFFVSYPGRTNSILDTSTETNHTCYDDNSGGMRRFDNEAGISNSPTVVEATPAQAAESSSSRNSTSSGNRGMAVVGGGVAVRKYSPDPYMDFRTSMEEMVEAARGTRERKDYNNNDGDDWEYLHELLLCYLSLNPKDTHKYIIGAFIDILLTLIAPDVNNNNEEEEESDQHQYSSSGGLNFAPVQG